MPKSAEVKTREMTISGYVESVELEDGNEGVLINDGDDDFYIVMDKTGKKLLDRMDEEVEVTGIVSRKRGELTLKVTGFNFLEDDDDFDDDMDDSWND